MKRLAVAFCCLLCGCGRQAPLEINIVSPHIPEIRKEFSDGFTAWYAARTGKQVLVRWLDVGGTGESIEYVKSRNDPKNPVGGVDIFFGGGDVPFFTLAKLDLLAPCGLPDSVIRNIPQELNGVTLYSPESLWYGAALSSFGILCNLEAAKRNGFQIPRTWADLAGPELAGWVATGDPRYSGTVHVMYEIILQAYGWEKGWEIILRMAANSKEFFKGASGTAKSVSLGQTAFGLSVDFYAFAEIERFGRDRLLFVLPESLSIVTPDGIGLLKNSHEPEIARAFILYVMTEGQKLWMFRQGEPGGPKHAALCRMSPDSTLYRAGAQSLAVTQNPFTAVTTRAYDGRLTGKRWALLNDLVASFLVANHRELRRAGNRNLRMPVTEKEAMALAPGWGDKDNALKRIQLGTQWQKTAGKE